MGFSLLISIKKTYYNFTQVLSGYMCTLRPMQFHSRISCRKSNECSNQVLWKEDKWKQPKPIHHSVPSSIEDQMQQIQRIEIFSWKGVILSSFGSCLLCYVQMKIPMHHNSRDFSVDFYSWSSAVGGGLFHSISFIWQYNNTLVYPINPFNI